MDKKKLFPMIKIVSAEQNKNFNVPLCSCDFFKAIDMPCLSDSKGFQHCSYDSVCAYVKNCVCDSKCLCDFDYTPKCTCDYHVKLKCNLHTDCRCDTKDCMFDKLVPLDNDLPESCVINVNIDTASVEIIETKIVGSIKKKNTKTVDPKNGELLKKNLN